MLNLPRRPSFEDPRLNRYMEQVERSLRSQATTSSATQGISRGLHGTTPVPLERRRPPLVRPVVLPPFDVTQYNAGNPTSDWRTFLVNQGFVNGQDWGISFSNNIIVEENTENHKIYLDVSITQSGQEIGLPSDVNIVDDEGWVDYPLEPAGDSDTGAPPEHYYIEIANITVGVDSPADDPDYHKVTLTQKVNTNLMVTMGVIGWSTTSDDPPKLALVRRMIHGAA